MGRRHAREAPASQEPMKSFAETFVLAPGADAMKTACEQMMAMPVARLEAFIYARDGREEADGGDEQARHGGAAEDGIPGLRGPKRSAARRHIDESDGPARAERGRRATLRGSIIHLPAWHSAIADFLFRVETGLFGEE